MSEVLHRAMIAGIGERQEGNAPNPSAPSTEIPGIGTMFSVVKKVDSAADFVDDEDESDDVDKPPPQQLDASAEPPCGAISDAPAVTPGKQKLKRLTSKSTPSPGNSLEILDACLPEEPRSVVVVLPTADGVTGVPGAGPTDLSPWLKQALFGTGNYLSPAAAAAGSTKPAATPPLTARLKPLAQRMRSLLLKGVYARQRAGKSTGVGKGKGAGWADGGRPAGFVGAGLAEELCLAVFGRIQALRAQGVGKQVCAV